jgi:hypothetical protein
MEVMFYCTSARVGGTKKKKQAKTPIELGNPQRFVFAFFPRF